ncbi:MAG: SAM-dependent methyltransferase [Planctomycetota bacterium]|jgi:SAM-dependent methyltransferase
MIDHALKDVSLLVPLDDERFLKTHEEFEARSNQRDRIIAWLCNHSDNDTTRTGDLNLLSLGCGDGSVDLPTTRKLIGKSDHVRFVGLDPNGAQLAKLEQAFAAAALPDVTLKTHELELGNFETAERFDHIHCVHSFYYMPDPAAALEHTISMLADDGELVFFHAPCEDLNALSTRFYDKYYERSTLFAEDFALLLDESGLSYRRERIDARIDVTSLFDEQHVHGHELRDFILQFDSHKLPVAVVEPVERYMRLIAEGSRSAAWIAHPVDVFVIRRRADATR